MHALVDWYLSFDSSFRLLLNTVAGALLGFLGTFLTAAVALWVLRKNLAFSRWKHRQDTEMALRKEVYANASDIFAETVLFFSQLPLPETKLEDGHATLRKLAGAMGKIQTVASPDTQKAALATNHRILEAYMDLARRKNVLNERLREVADLNERLQHLESQKNSIEVYRDQVNRDPNYQADRAGLNRDLFDRLTNLLKAISSLAANRDALAHENQTDFLIAMEATTAHLKDLGRLNIELILAFRSELGIQTDAHWLREEMEGMMGFAQTESASEIRAVRQKLGIYTQ